MAKPLATILKKYSDVIAGKLPASEINALTLGKEPGVDYAPKMADEREFVASHSVEKFPDRVGNGPDVYNGAKIKQAIDDRHGHIPNPKSKNQYTQANEEVEELDETSGAKAERYKKAARSGLLHLAVHTKDGPDKNRKIVNRAAGIERADRAIDKDIAKRSAAQKKRLGEAKDNREYDYEGEMAVTKLKTICRHAEHLIDMMKPNTNLPEWVQSKIVKAEDYISTAHDYLMSEMNEEVEITEKEIVKKVKGLWKKVSDAHDKKMKENDDFRRKELGPELYKKLHKEAKLCETCGKTPCGCDTNDKSKKPKKLLLEPQVNEESTSQAQQKLMAMAYRYKQNPNSMPDASAQVKELAKTMTIKQLRDFAKTKRSELPKKVQKESTAVSTTPIKMPSNPSNETADYNSGYNLGRWNV